MALFALRIKYQELEYSNIPEAFAHLAIAESSSATITDSTSKKKKKHGGKSKNTTTSSLPVEEKNNTVTSANGTYVVVFVPGVCLCANSLFKCIHW